MKGVILSLPVRNKKSITVKKEYKRDFKADLRRYLPVGVLVLFFTAGVISGSAAFSAGDKAFWADMDFIFPSVFDYMSIPRSFVAFFGSDFLFFSMSLLCGLSPWGSVAVPFVYGFKGFGTGFAGAMLICTMGLKGFGFYLTVVLPGAFLFSLCLLFYSVRAMAMSVRIGYSLFSRNSSENSLPHYAKGFLRLSGKYLILTFLCALCDVFFRTFVAKIWF